MTHLPPAYLPLAEAPSSTTGDLGVLLVLLAVVALVLVVNAARNRRNARLCARYGHAPDPATVGTWRETCARCGARPR